MMKSPRNWTVAVRDQKGSIHLKKERLSEMPRILKLPLLRGVVALGQALSLGMKAIEFSANKAYEDESGGGEIGNASFAITVLTAVLLAVGLFIVLPLYATKLLGNVFQGVAGSSLLFNLTDGVFRVLVFLLYVVAIGFWKEMARIFMYHGAEHKVIHAYEEGKELTLENVRDYSPQHPRCGTSFLMIVMVMSILIFSVIPRDWSFIAKAASRVALVPVIAGLSFEFLRWSARWSRNAVMHFLVLPGLMLQRLTTREPDDAQLEVALSALQEVLRLEEEHAQ